MRRLVVRARTLNCYYHLAQCVLISKYYRGWRIEGGMDAGVELLLCMCDS